ncbi:hypothetical protein A2721_02870 [Candidatus Gottesmanbacteria bacterium RIFCSPHIGHO2_01_FULL_47_48]|uniref:Uncharacterized protein n=1 Tax=Candidatus Gottesmanbacteria bacterium RIFCSPHIGHO2_01_FULL_47_48 TaxID=1798381 RepID=A0A1F6A449_9BACT|nr:MAG: hypothetical protein A2721_02870 [Candidatus Gottesmanbacteria bacterium RIFCSPHIGHO2_01_FULL_47_48]
MAIDPDWFAIFEAVCINVASTLLGAVIVGPNLPGASFETQIVILTGDVFMGIVLLLIAFRLRKLSKGRKK